MSAPDPIPADSISAEPTSSSAPAPNGAPVPNGTAAPNGAPAPNGEATKSGEPSFQELGLEEKLLRALGEAGYSSPSPIQKRAIPVLLEGRDLLGQAQTGTGKTAAFALPILQRLDPKVPRPQALILTPTRELALQVANAFESYGKHSGTIRVLAVYGGQHIDPQLRALNRGVHVVVGTPGRVMDHLRRGTLKLDRLETIVLDEADEMLRMGFLEDVEWILEQAPKERQTALFSATLPEPVRKTARRHLVEPVEVHIRSKTSTVAATKQLFWRVDGTSKLAALSRILAAEDVDAAIVFVRTKQTTVWLAEQLEERGIACAALNGDLGQSMRESIVERLRNRRLDLVIATDVAARGLDVSHISHVINYDMPMDTEAYVHRIGRTGRAGREGRAILFVHPRETHMLRMIERTTRQPLEKMHLPTAASIEKRRIDSFKQKIVETIDKEDLGFFREIIDQLRTEHAVSTGEAAAALAYLAQKDRPLRGAARGLESDRKKPAGASGSADAARRPNAEGGRPAAADRPRRRTEEGMVCYRMEIGRNQGIRYKDIVGAIANESGIDAEFIGRIELRDDHSFVDLPKGMPREIYKHLQQVRVRNHDMRLRRIDDDRPAREARRPHGKRHGDSRGKGGPPRGPRPARRPHSQNR